MLAFCNIIELTFLSCYYITIITILCQSFPDFFLIFLKFYFMIPDLSHIFDFFKTFINIFYYYYCA